MHRSATTLALAGCLATALSLPALAGEARVEISAVTVDGVGEAAGAIAFADSPWGLLIAPDLAGLEPGIYGFHVHQNPDCGPGPDAQGTTIAAGAAGGHYDPEGTGVHAGPYGEGHLGDMPNLVVAADGTATMELLAPRLTAADLAGRAIVIHAGADHYDADHPGGARAWCGLVE